MLAIIATLKTMKINPDEKRFYDSTIIVDDCNLEAAKKLAVEMSIELGYNTGELYALYANKALDLGYELNSYEFEAFVEELIRQDVKYDIYRIDKWSRIEKRG